MQIKKVKNSDIAINTWFGGADCVASAARVKCNTTKILVKEVTKINKEGARAIMVNIIIISTLPANPSSPLVCIVKPNVGEFVVETGTSVPAGMPVLAADTFPAIAKHNRKIATRVKQLFIIFLFCDSIL